MSATQSIPGVPEGWKLVAIRIPKEGDRFIDAFGRIAVGDGNNGVTFPIVTPDNVYNLPLSEVPIPEGYEWTGEFRVPANEEPFVSTCSFSVCTSGPLGPDYRRLILRPIKPKTKKVLVLEISDKSAIERCEKGAYFAITTPGWVGSSAPVWADSSKVEERPA